MGIIGVVVGLPLATRVFGFTVLPGLVSHTGVVRNDAIVLIDRIRTYIDEYGMLPGFVPNLCGAALPPVVRPEDRA